MSGNYTFKTIDDLKADIRALAPSLPFAERVDPSIFRRPLAVEGFAIPNRLCAHPMEGCDGTADGRPGELTIRKYKRLLSSKSRASIARDAADMYLSEMSV